MSMTQRIAQLEAIWGGVQLRLSCGRDPREDEGFRELLSHPPPRLERQTNAELDMFQLDFDEFEFPPPTRLFRATNRHELLHKVARVRYWEASTKDERDAIMIEEGICPDA